MNEIFATIKPYIQPFEKTLALRELAALAGAEPVLETGDSRNTTAYRVTTSTSIEHLVSNLAYWEKVGSVDGNHLTSQTLRESTVKMARNSVPLDVLQKQLPFGADVPVPNRRCLRYGTHGLHEYRGKFFPQLVRSLINVSNVQPDAVVADPMSGSGTTVIEALLSGRKGLGLDMNPLSVYISNVKAKLLTANATRLHQCYDDIHEQLHRRVRGKRNTSYFNSLPEVDREYLSAWFSEQVIVSLDEVKQAIDDVSYGLARDLMSVALSNILRKVSWQKDDDLRVRRQVRLDVELDPKNEFLVELERSVRAVLAFLYQSGPLRKGSYRLQEGDARQCGSVWGLHAADVVITSPPYATALPYLDTDRLSLCYLGLLSRNDHRKRDLTMIGNREISERIRINYWSDFSSKKDLPSSVMDLINKIDSLNSGPNVGFRRKNLPALLSKYFYDMGSVISGMYTSLKPGCLAYMVVGNNHTMAAGQRVEIETTELLKDIARAVRFDVLDSIPMEVLVSRDIFRRNAMATEKILVFMKPA